MLSRFEKSWALAILFINGWVFALPLTDNLPLILTPIQVVRGIFLHEALLALYVLFVFALRGAYLPAVPSRARVILALIASLGVLALISATANLRPFKEVLGAGRYFLLAAYFLVAIDWARRYGPTFILRNFLLGLVCAGIVNLYFSFVVRFAELGGLPFLLGQAGPGGYLGISVLLSAWLMLERRTRLDMVVALATCVVGAFAASISFSKLSMLMAGAGLLAWSLILLKDFNRPRLRVWYAVALIAVGITIGVNYDRVAKYVRGARTFIDYKFRYLDKASITSRSHYFLITAEILSRHPLFGVSYGGFYDAATATEAYRMPGSAPEDPEAGARGESNPHSSFLYYTSANGIGGVVLVLALFVSSIAALWHSLSGRGFAGRVLWACLAGGYLVFGLTLPTLFNTAILYLSVAVACTDS